MFFLNKTVICDRWVIEILIDLEVDTKLEFSQDSFVYRLFKSLLPENHQYFIIKREFNTVRQARDENMNDRNFPKRYNLYERHSKESGVQVINNNGTLKDTSRKIVEMVS